MKKSLNSAESETAAYSSNTWEENIDLDNLGEIIANARKAIGITQKELADRIGTNQTYISKIENNVTDIRLYTLLRIIHDGLGGKLQISVTTNPNDTIS